MKNDVLNIISEYLKLYPNETEKIKIIIDFVNRYNDEEIIDWNNFDGHIVASGFVYAKKEKKFIMLYHNEFNRYVYPGGHVDQTDITILDAAKREIKEETGISNISEVVINNNQLMPIDIDIHHIGYNQKLNLPEHYHYDFRYLFFVDKIEDVIIDKNESDGYKWVSVEDLLNEPYLNKVANKLIKYINY